MSSRRPKTANAVAAEIRRRRFQLPAPRPVRRNRVSVSIDFFPEPARKGFCRRRIRPRRAAAAPAIASRSALSGAGRRRGLFSAAPAGARHARLLPGDPSPRRQHRSFRAALHFGNHFSRRQVNYPFPILVAGKGFADLSLFAAALSPRRFPANRKPSSFSTCGFGVERLAESMAGKLTQKLAVEVISLLMKY